MKKKSIIANTDNRIKQRETSTNKKIILIKKLSNNIFSFSLPTISPTPNCNLFIFYSEDYYQYTFCLLIYIFSLQLWPPNLILMAKVLFSGLVSDLFWQLQLWYFSFMFSEIVPPQNICGFSSNVILRIFWIFWFIYFQ